MPFDEDFMVRASKQPEAAPVVPEITAQEATNFLRGAMGRFIAGDGPSEMVLAASNVFLAVSTRDAAVKRALEA